MSTNTFANRHRPKKFSEVVGQEDEIAVLKKIVAGGWTPNAVMITGPFGTGKTTLARLLTRALHCSNRQPDADGIKTEPCGECNYCQAMDLDSSSYYVEVDAASQGAVADVRGMKDLLSYRTGDKRLVLCYDESHMLSVQAQNALLQTLEEGRENVLFLFCTTEANKMLPTVQSRCVVLGMKLLSPAMIRQRLQLVCQLEKIEYEEKALLVLASYVRGHARDALVMLEQLSRMAPIVTEELTRSYLRLDKHVEVYKFLTTSDKKEALVQLEQLLCNYAPSELSQTIGTILVNAYKAANAVGDFTKVDEVWLQKVKEAIGYDNLLPMGEKIMTLRTDYATIDYGIASMGAIIIEGRLKSEAVARPVIPTTAAPIIGGMRKPGKE